MSPSAAYVVDLMHSRSAEAIAANAFVFAIPLRINFHRLTYNYHCSGLRSTLLAATVPVIFPMIEAYGVAVTNTTSAFLALIGFG